MALRLSGLRTCIVYVSAPTCLKRLFRRPDKATPPSGNGCKRLMALRLSGLRTCIDYVSAPTCLKRLFRRPDKASPPSGNGCKCLMALRLSGLQKPRLSGLQKLRLSGPQNETHKKPGAQAGFSVYAFCVTPDGSRTCLYLNSITKATASTSE